MDAYSPNQELLPGPEEYALVDLDVMKPYLDSVKARSGWPEEYRNFDPLPPLWPDEPDAERDSRCPRGRPVGDES